MCGELREPFTWGNTVYVVLKTTDLPDLKYVLGYVFNSHASQQERLIGKTV